MSDFVECFLILCITIIAILAIIYDRNVKVKSKKNKNGSLEAAITIDDNDKDTKSK